MRGKPPDPESLAEALAPLQSAPAAGAILCDLDGTLAPIVPRAEDAAVPEPTRRALAAVAERYALTAVVTGRRALDARRMVGLDAIMYSGNHGFELLLPGEPDSRPHPSLDGHEQDAAQFVSALDPEELAEAGIRVEDKGAITALHWRQADNEGEAEALANEIAGEAEWRELIPHRGRKVLEIRPNVPINKGIAVAGLVPAAPVSTALYGGDDRTDVDAFVALRTLEQDGKLEDAVCIGVDSDEAPPELAPAADLMVEGPPGFRAVLERLAR